MKLLVPGPRLLVCLFLALFVLAVLPHNLHAQSATVSPSNLAFGVPTGTSPELSAAQTITVSILGASTSDPVSFSSSDWSVNGPNSADFSVTGDSCANNTFTSSSTCQFFVVFTATQNAGILETATLTITYSAAGTAGTLNVSLSGAYGAITLFNETNITPTTATFGSLYTIASKQLDLSCPASPTATISGTPDGKGYVLVDNYITLATGTPLAPVNDVPFSSEFPKGNVCGGPGSSSDYDSVNGSDDNNCVSDYYVDEIYTMGVVPTNPDPDSFANPNNSVLQAPAHGSNAGGVPPINVVSFLGGPYPEQTMFTLSSSGAELVYDNSTLFLVTNCTAPGIIPGASVTLNSVSSSNPASETQTAALDSSPGQNISFTASDAVAVQQGTVTLTSTGVVPIVTDYPIPQQLFNQLVIGTSAAPAVCFRLTGETDPSGQPMCKAFLFQCYDPNTNTTSGSNCTPYQSTARNVLFTAQFSSPDGPVVPNVYNYLTTQTWAANTAYTSGQTIVDSFGNVQLATSSGTSGSSSPFSSNETVGTATADNGLSWTDQGPNACANVGPNDACAIGTGPALLMGSDNWLCADEQSSCTPPLSVTTQTSGTVYYQSNCVMELPLSAANLCPFDVLTQFQGAADGQPGGSTKPKSIFIPVANMPLPSASASFGSTGNNGWINSLSSATATFTSTSASYPSSPSGNPSGNSFKAAAPYTLTFGVSQAPNLPDTTYPVPGDQIIYNQNTNNSTDIAYQGMPICGNSGPTPSGFTPQAIYNSSTGTLTILPNGSPLGTPAGYFSTLSLQEGDIYYLHYFTTDCAYTEGLVFSPTSSQLSNGSANWASFPFMAFGVDTTPPTISGCMTSPSGPAYAGGGGWYSGEVTISCNALDNESGFAPGLPVPNTNNAILQGSSTTYLSLATNCGKGNTCPMLSLGPLQATDLAGNISTTSYGAFTFNIDEQAPTVSGPTLTNNPGTYNGAPIGVSYSCTDTGSGVQSCTLNNSNSSPIYSTAPTCTAPTTAGAVSCSAALSTSALQSGTLSVTTTDNVGNTYTSPAVSYSVGTEPLIITASNTTSVYGSTPPAPTASYTYGGTTSSTPPTGVTPASCVTSATSTTPVGTDVGANTCSGASGTNYSISYVAGNATVTAEPLTITASNTTSVYGSAPQVPSPLYTYGVVKLSPTAPSNLTTAPTCVTSATSSSSVGTYANTCSGAVGSNYSINYVAGIETVTAEALTITASNTSFTSGSTPQAPSPLYTYGNVSLSSTTPAGLTAPTCTTTVTKSSAAGTYPGANTCSGASGTNYSISYVAGTATVTAPPVWTITPASYTFPTLSIGQTASETFVVTNPVGGATTSIVVSIPGSPKEGSSESGEIDPDDYVITTNGCTSALAGGKSCSVIVTWTPDSDDLPLYSKGGSLAYLQVVNKSTNAVLAQASMAGKAIDPTVTLTPESNTFTATSATTQLVATLSNPGPTSLILGNISITSGSKYFQLASGTNSCPANSTMAPGAAPCNIYVTFTPPSGSATETGQVTIQSNAANGTLTVSLSGKR